MIDTRKFDLEELMENRLHARNRFERDLYDRGIEKIMRESGVIRSEREKLMMAIYNNDRRAVHYFQERIIKLRMDETYGRSG